MLMKPCIGTEPPPIRFALARLMRKHRVTIRELARRMGVPMKRVRAVRDAGRAPYPTVCDFTQAVTGVNVYSRARWEAMRKQAAAYHDGLDGRV